MSDISLYEKIPTLENNFTVKFRLYEKRTSALIPHWHEHIELMYILEGECDFICAGRVYNAGAGDLMVANGSEIHSFEVKKTLSFFSVLLFPSFFDDIDFDGIRIMNTVTSDGYVKDCISDMRREYDSGKRLSDMMLKSHAYRLLAHLARNYPAENAEKSNVKIDTSHLLRLNRVLEYISENYTEKISTKELASMCYLSEAHFCRFFKSAVGKTAMEYVNQYRIEKAAVLLKNTDGQISAVAQSTGFDDINYFSRTFKKIKGLSPGEYRKSLSV